jgi:formylglycine-generating enzyme required for sulfatase activity
VPLALVTACASPSGAPAGDTTAAPSAAASAEPPLSTDEGTSRTAAASAAPPAPAASGPCPGGMVFVAGGTFRRHKPGQKKTVTVRGYCLDRGEVTVHEYKECVKQKKCSPRCLEVGRCTAVPADADWPDPREAIRASLFCNGSRSDRDDHPVNCVSFDEAKGFCAARDERLPTGDEWEWAIVGAAAAPAFPWGQTAPAGGDLCWGKPYKRSSTCLPGEIARDTTRDGIVDMAGNLSEWVVEGTAERPLRRLRGASWYSIDDGYVQASMWGFDSTSTRSEVFGFRCARDAASARP